MCQAIHNLCLILLMWGQLVFLFEIIQVRIGCVFESFECDEKALPAMLLYPLNQVYFPHSVIFSWKFLIFCWVFVPGLLLM